MSLIKDAIKTMFTVYVLVFGIIIMYISWVFHSFYYKVYRRLIYGEVWFWDVYYGKGWILNCGESNENKSSRKVS